MNEIAARRGYKSAVAAVAYRLCRILFAMLRDVTDFNPSRRRGIEQGNFTRSTTYMYPLTPKPAGRLWAAG